MKCISKEMIQKFIDNEASEREIDVINEHICKCKICEKDINQQRQLANDIKNTVNLLSEGHQDIPKFNPTTNPFRKHILTKKQIIYSISAASVLLVLFLVIQLGKELKVNNQEDIIRYSPYETDANRSIKEQPLVVKVVDPKGNVSEYLIK